MYYMLVLRQCNKPRNITIILLFVACKVYEAIFQIYIENTNRNCNDTKTSNVIFVMMGQWNISCIVLSCLLNEFGEDMIKGTQKYFYTKWLLTSRRMKKKLFRFFTKLFLFQYSNYFWPSSSIFTRTHF